MADFYGRRPLHIPAASGSGRAALMSWEKLNALLEIQHYWDEKTLSLWKNGNRITPDLYMEELVAMQGKVRRASMAKVEVYLAMGASLVAHAVQQISAELRELADMLAARLAGRTNINVYCSFEGVRALATHFDTHEVFAVHCEGQKVWRVYVDRAEAPLREDTRYGRTNSATGPHSGELLFEVVMRPGDILYIPRGFYHDALAGSGGSVHLTFSVTPRSGSKFFSLLEEAAMRDPLFRAWLPEAEQAEGRQLRAHLEALRTAVSNIISSDAFFAEVAASQRALARNHRRLALPERPTLDFFVTAGVKAAVVIRDAGAFLQAGEDRVELALGQLRREAEWVLGRAMFSVQEFSAHFPHRSNEELRGLLAELCRGGVLRSASPRL